MADYLPKLWIYLGDITKYSVFASTFAMKANGAPWVNWWLKDNSHLLQDTTSILYHHAMTSLNWL